MRTKTVKVRADCLTFNWMRLKIVVGCREIHRCSVKPITQFVIANSGRERELRNTLRCL